MARKKIESIEEEFVEIVEEKYTVKVLEAFNANINNRAFSGNIGDTIVLNKTEYNVLKQKVIKL
jgi:hypothetical protein